MIDARGCMKLYKIHDDGRRLPIFLDFLTYLPEKSSKKVKFLKNFREPFLIFSLKN